MKTDQTTVEGGMFGSVYNYRSIYDKSVVDKMAKAQKKTVLCVSPHYCELL
jgi:hypothetical protein